jgi:hypothetical protein
MESNRYTSSGFSMLNNYIAEHAAFVLMHISRHLCNTGQSFQRNIFVLLVNVVISCTGHQLRVLHSRMLTLRGAVFG